MNTFFSKYQSRDVIQDVYHTIHHRDLNAEGALEIASSIRQAEEYIKSSKESSILIAPILHYYGIASLCRSLYLMLSGSREATIVQSHGLETKNWRETLSNGLISIKDLKLKINENGFFRQLLKVSENQDCSKIFTGPYPNCINYRVKYDIGNSASEISFHQVWENVLSTARIYKQLDEDSYFMLANNFILRKDDGGSQIDVCVLESENMNPEIISQKFGISENGISKSDESHFFGHIPHYRFRLQDKEEWLRINHPSIETDKFNFVYMIPGFGETFISQLGCHFMGLYANGMLARYYPKEWMQLSWGTKGDRYYPVIKEIMNSYPDAIIDICYKLLEYRIAMGRDDS